MKKLLLLLFFIGGIVNSQIINIPDPVFKAKLLSADVSNTIAGSGVISYISNAYVPTSYVKIDTNNDGEIQVSEAMAVTYLKVNRATMGDPIIYDLTGLEAFTNLKYLYCDQNQISNLPVSNLISHSLRKNQ